MKIVNRFCALLTLLFLISCANVEPIPERSETIEKDISKIQKHIVYQDAIIFLQSRMKGIRTNDLIIQGKNSELSYLSDNKFYIQDFCITKDGILYYIEAGRDSGSEPLAGVRSSQFTIKHINLNSKKYEIKDFFPDKGSQLTIKRPKNLELDSQEKLICFATDFGEIYVIDRFSKQEINILPPNTDPRIYNGKHLSLDRKSFVVNINMTPNTNGRYIWKRHSINLETKAITGLP